MSAESPEPAPAGRPDDATRLRLGGMALRNGLLVHGPTHWAAAVRRGDGSLGVASGPKPRVHAGDEVPGVRGVLRLGESLAVVALVKRKLPEAQLPFQNPPVLAVAIGAALVAARLRRRGAGGLAGELGAALASLAPAVAALRGGDLASYHGVEHKAIGAYEHDAGGWADAVAQTPKEHDRCGSHLLAPMIASNLVGTVLLSRLGDSRPRWAAGVVTLVSLGISVEVFGWSERNRSTALARLLRAPGHELQRVLGTREPSASQLEVGRAALAEILRVEPPPA